MQDESGEMDDNVRVRSSTIPNTHERTPADIERQILALSTSSSPDEIREAICASDWLMSRARDVQQLTKQVVIEWIDANGEFDIGDMHYSVGYPLSVKCIDVFQTGHTVLKATGGDFDQFLSVLAAQPYKHASVRSFIGIDLHNQLFKSFRTGKLISGVSQRTLQCSDKRF